MYNESPTSNHTHVSISQRISTPPARCTAAFTHLKRNMRAISYRIAKSLTPASPTTREILYSYKILNIYLTQQSAYQPAP